MPGVNTLPSRPLNHSFYPVPKLKRDQSVYKSGDSKKGISSMFHMLQNVNIG